MLRHRQGGRTALDEGFVNLEPLSPHHDQRPAVEQSVVSGQYEGVAVGPRTDEMQSERNAVSEIETLATVVVKQGGELPFRFFR